MIVGGGVVGLSASLFLAQQGVGSVLVERHPGTSIHPRSRGVNGRTMELLRGLGLEKAVVAASEKLGPSIGIYRGETLLKVLEEKGDGGWFARRQRRGGGMRGQKTKASPVGPCRCTQDELEPVLLQAARERGVQTSFFSEVTDLQLDEAGVTANVIDRANGQSRVIRAAYVLAADGAKGAMRERLDIAAPSSGPLGHQLNVYFRADLGHLVKGRELSMCLIENGALRGLLTSINNTDLWVLHVSYAPGTEAEYPPERCADLVRAAVGLNDLDA